MTDNKLADYVLVPRVPTEAMFDAGVERHRPQNMSAARLRLIWDAMLSAAPVQPPALPEVTDADVAAAWDVLLITGQPIDSCAGGDMRKVLESYRARLMAKAGGDRG